METVLGLREQRAANVTKMRKILDAAETAKRAISGEEQQEYTRLDQEVDALKGKIDQRERLDVLERELAAPATQRGGNQPQISTADPTEEQRNAKKKIKRAAWETLLRHGQSHLSAEQRSAIEVRATGEGTITGYDVDDGFQIELFRNLKFWSGVEQAPITVKETDTGNSFPILVSDDTSNTGELLAENTTTASNVDPTYTQATLGAYNFSSKAMLVSMQALNDITSLEQDIVANAAIRIGRIRGSYFTTGTGSSQPTGVVTAATTAGLSVVGATGETTSLVSDDLINLEHKIDPAYRLQSGANGKKLCGYMFHDSTLKSIKLLKDTLNRYLWLPGLAANDPDTINGYPYYINNFMATMAANAKSIVFGYWPAFIVRNVKQTIFLRLDQRYADSFQVGFIAMVRSDSKVAQTNAFAYFANSAT